MLYLEHNMTEPGVHRGARAGLCAPMVHVVVCCVLGCALRSVLASCKILSCSSPPTPMGCYGARYPSARSKNPKVSTFPKFIQMCQNRFFMHSYDVLSMVKRLQAHVPALFHPFWRPILLISSFIQCGATVHDIRLPADQMSKLPKYSTFPKISQMCQNMFFMHFYDLLSTIKRLRPHVHWPHA